MSAEKILRKYSNIRASSIFLKLFDSSLIIIIITIVWQVISEVTRLKNLLSRNIIGLCSIKILKLILKAVISDLRLRLFGISFIKIYHLY